MNEFKLSNFILFRVFSLRVTKITFAFHQIIYRAREHRRKVHRKKVRKGKCNQRVEMHTVKAH